MINLNDIHVTLFIQWHISEASSGGSYWTFFHGQLRQWVESGIPSKHWRYYNHNRQNYFCFCQWHSCYSEVLKPYDRIDGFAYVEQRIWHHRKRNKAPVVWYQIYKQFHFFKTHQKTYSVLRVLQMFTLTSFFNFSIALLKSDHYLSSGIDFILSGRIHLIASNKIALL